MGSLYRARDLALERPVAVKVLDAQQLGDAGRKRLLHEARAAAQLNHPNIVSIHDVGEDNGSPYIVMEYVEGPSLHAQRPTAIPDIVRIARDVCAALEHAHSHGLVHRDLKPENILGHMDGAAKLTDFGLARPIASRITSEGALTGTVFYLAPEQALGQVIDGRVDLYALGVMLYELVTRRLPFTADDPLAVVSQHLHAPVVPPSTYNPEVPSALESLILSLLSKQPEDRPPSAGLVGEALAAMDLSPGGSPQPRQALFGIARGRFVGREKELALCKAAWLDAASGHRQVVLIEGEPGIGKTRLAAELDAQVRVLGGQVLTGECYAEGMAPYAPIGEVVRQALGDGAEPGLKLQPFVLDDLVLLAPALRSFGRRRRAAPGGSPAGDMQGLCDSLVALFAHLTRRAPVMLLIEDLQWADRGTLHLLRCLTHRAHVTDLRLLVVLTYRPVESQQGLGLYDFLLEFERHAQGTQISLQPFTLLETRQLLEAMFRREITQEFLEGIQHETEGNPFFVEEVCRSLVTQGRLYLEAGRWERGKTMAELGIPQTLRAAILSRFARLTPETRDTLRRAAIIGQEFEVEVLTLTSDLTPEELDACLEEAETAQFVHPLPEGARARWTFAHALMPQALVGELPSIRSERLHARVGDAIERAHADRLDQVYSVLGWHFAHAGQASKAADYLLRAGDAAQSVLAFDQAIADYEGAIPLLQQLEDPERLAQVKLKLGSLYHAGFRFDDSRRAYREGFVAERERGGGSRLVGSTACALPPAPHPLRLAGVDPVTLDPGMTDDIWDVLLSGQLFSGLLECNPEMVLLPEMALSWEILDGGRKYIFHLRDDWRWSDGVAVTARDFEYAWRRVLDPRTHSPNRRLLIGIRGGAAFDPSAEPPVDNLGIHAAGEWTLVVELEEPAGHFLHLLAIPAAFPVPRHVVEAHGDLWTDPPYFVSNGPFRLEARVPGEPWTLRLRPEYPGRVRGNVEQVEIVRLREGMQEVWDPTVQSLALYEQGRIDVAETGFLDSSRTRHQFAREEVAWPMPGTFSIWLNLCRPPLNDPRVRRALGLGMDRSLIVALTYGEGVRPADGGFVARGVPGHSPGIGLDYDPDQARALLAEAGFPGGQGFPSISLIHTMTQISHDLARNLTEQWQQNLGIHIETCGLDYYTYVDRVHAREFDLHVICWMAEYPDPDSFLRGAIACAASLDWSDEYAGLVAEAARLLDQRTRFELYARADRMLCEQAVILPIAYDLFHAFMKPWIRREPKWYARGGCWKDAIIDPH
jgi:ABC-type oligopeptide transport system substrate-binding subunit